LAVAEHDGIQSEFIPGLATGFCSGVARTGGQCGALNGGILSLGLLNGRQEPGGTVDQVYAQVQALVGQFEAAFGSLNCRELTGCHLGTSEGQQQYRQTGQLQRCLDYVEMVTRLVLEMAER
jgi:C_GCAxxG_C_C family probable redox protein